MLQGLRETKPTQTLSCCCLQSHPTLTGGTCLDFPNKALWFLTSLLRCWRLWAMHGKSSSDASSRRAAGIPPSTALIQPCQRDPLSLPGAPHGTRSPAHRSSSFPSHTTGTSRNGCKRSAITSFRYLIPNSSWKLTGSSGKANWLNTSKLIAGLTTSG